MLRFEFDLMTSSFSHGHPFVLDLLNLDMLEAAEKLFDQVQPGLMASIMDRSILQEEKSVVPGITVTS